MKLALTNGEIIEAGLAIAGRPDLITEARLWLSLFLEDFYENQDVEWLVKTLDNQALVDGMDMPEDYRAMSVAELVNSAGNKLPLEVTSDVVAFKSARQSINPVNGQPSLVWADHDRGMFFFNPVPSDSSYSINLAYYYFPEIADYTDADVFDAAVPKWGMATHTLVDFIKAIAMEYNDDERQGTAYDKVMARIAQGKLNQRDKRGGSSRMKMGKRFKKRFS